MKKRYCDQCKREIIAREDYYKILFQEHKDKAQVLSHAADFCKNCFDKDTGKN